MQYGDASDESISIRNAFLYPVNYKLKHLLVVKNLYEYTSMALNLNRLKVTNAKWTFWYNEGNEWNFIAGAFMLNELKWSC